MTKNRDHRWANPERHKAMLGLRSSSAASPHTPKPRKGTRHQREREAIRDQGRQGGRRDEGA